MTLAHNIINLSSTEPSDTAVKVTNTGFRQEIEPTRKRLCDMWQQWKAPSRKGVVYCLQEENATDAQGHKTILQATLGMQAVNSEENTKEETFPERQFGVRYQIYSNHSPEDISTLHSDKN